MLSKMKISRKLPVLILSIALAISVGLGVLAYKDSSSALNAEVVKKLEVTLQSRKATLLNYLQGIEEDLTVISVNPFTVQAANEFTAAFAELGEGASGYLQKAYITDNPHPTGEKEKLDAAGDGSAYSKVHGQFHDWFRTNLNTREYYDIFIFDLKGNLVYSVFKELDYATNLVTGKWKESGLGQVFRAAAALPAGSKPAFIDFAPYAPSYDAPASFMGLPIVDAGGKKVGVLAYQMPITRIDTVMNDATGLGETGETYIFGEDFLMRSSSRFSEESTILKKNVDSSASRAAIAGDSGNKVTENQSGELVKKVYAPLGFLGTKWGIMAEMSEAEYLAPNNALRNDLAIATVVMLLLAGFVGITFSRSITKALGGITSAMTKLANGENETDVPILSGAMKLVIWPIHSISLKRMHLSGCALRKRPARVRKKLRA
ncbi:cache domain-containing protein [Sneathiella glossodoripedis]|uniref:cache domain-containing protein n=1 Tax=Sneathiella glossodoripedis TaxID=418853 RepID=UPI0006885B7A|nr:cache domain-containing protein [Sneathiella glossodoripedis]